MQVKDVREQDSAADVRPKWQNAPTGMAQAPLRFKNQLTGLVSQMTDKIFRKSIESPPGNQSQMTINTATAVMVCEQDGIELAGTIVAPRMRPPR